MTIQSLDINCDMGESFGNWNMGNDTEVMPLITTANVACGFHAGDPVTIRNTIRLAKKCDVAVGAHPGVPDLLGFGRRVMDVTPEDIYAYIVYQVGAVKSIAVTEEMPLMHVKPHGAMFHLMQVEDLVEAALDGISAAFPGVAVYWPGPIDRWPFTRKASERGFRVFAEFYPDLNYNGEGALIVERKKQWIDPNIVYERVCQMLKDNEHTTSNGNTVPMDVSSVCIHGDGPNAVDVLRAVHRAAKDCNIEVACAAT